MQKNKWTPDLSISINFVVHANIQCKYIYSEQHYYKMG